MFIKSQEIVYVDLSDWVTSITDPYHIRGIITADSDFNIDSHVYLNLINDNIEHPHIVVRSFLNFDVNIQVRAYMYYV